MHLANAPSTIKSQDTVMSFKGTLYGRMKYLILKLIGMLLRTLAMWHLDGIYVEDSIMSTTNGSAHTIKPCTM